MGLSSVECEVDRGQSAFSLSLIAKYLTEIVNPARAVQISVPVICGPDCRCPSGNPVQQGGVDSLKSQLRQGKHQTKRSPSRVGDIECGWSQPSCNDVLCAHTRKS